MSIYDLSVLAVDGSEVSMQEYKNKVLLIVNTATGCGFTPQYEGLQTLYDQYQDRGFVVLDFPCNQFGHQAPGNDAEIQTFCTTNYGTTFPRFAKIDVNGKNASPLFLYLQKQKGGLLSSKIKWNFTKFLVDAKGNVTGRFAPTIKPEELADKIVALLPN